MLPLSRYNFKEGPIEVYYETRDIGNTTILLVDNIVLIISFIRKWET